MTAAPPVITLDYETLPIEDRPDYPPAPAGLSIKKPGQAPRYLAFGHASGNNCSRDDARGELYEAHMSGLPILFHNAKFDLEVTRVGMDFPFFDPTHGDNWRRIHDTMFLAFLVDPHARKHDLKSLATEWLNQPPEERDELAVFAWENRQELERLMALAGKPYAVKRAQRERGSQAPVQASNPYHFYAAMPGNIVADYANGDTARTEALFNEWYPLAAENGMLPAYDRERRVLPIFMENERIGIRADLENLRADTSYFQQVLAWTEARLAERLGVLQGFNFDADEEYARALVASGIVREADFPLTPTGKLSVAKDALKPELFADAQFAQAMGYRNRLKTCLTMFMEPWLRQGSERSDGYISTNWNQTRGEGGGTRTGRPSTSNPNFLNISKDFEGRSDGYLHPEFLGVAQLPLVRKYLLPDNGDIWCHRDFSGQELRMFAHFESGELAAQYLINPRIDVHQWISDVIFEKTGERLERTRVKNVTFSRLYGGGLGAIERQAKCSSRAEAQQISGYHDAALPGRVIVDEECKRVARRGEPIVTWGGRKYFVEPPQGGRSFDYKLINYLIQGSAADFTKDRLIAWDDFNKSLNGFPPARFLVTVYDEINISAPSGYAAAHMKALREIMEAPGLIDVPMLSDGKWGDAWGRLEKTE